MKERMSTQDVQAVLDQVPLSAFEKDCLAEWAAGKSYRQIAADFGRDYKNVDNALQRVKRKIKDFYSWWDL